MANFTFWGVIASPFQLKMQALTDFAGHSWQRWPDQASWPAGIKMSRQLEKLRKTASVKRSRRHRAHVGSRGELYLSEHLAALLAIIGDTFIPLMQQNTAAYEDALAAGETLFNEAAFDQGRALYDGELLGYPFRSVAKSFQVPVWRDLCIAWRDLGLKSQENLSRQFPTLCDSAFESN